MKKVILLGALMMMGCGGADGGAMASEGLTPASPCDPYVAFGGSVSAAGCYEVLRGVPNACGNAAPKDGYSGCCCANDAASRIFYTPLDAGGPPAVIGCTDRGDADIPTATVTDSDAETACLVAHCTESVQCGDPGRTTCVEPHGVDGLTGIWSCPLGCCY